MNGQASGGVATDACDAAQAILSAAYPARFTAYGAL